MLLLPVLDSMTDELEKIAARRGLKMLRQLVQGGNVDKAQRLAKTPGVLKDSPLGSQLRMLSNAPTKEGPVMLTAHPDRGLAATKMYHPKGKATRRLISAKEELGKIDHPANVRLLGKSDIQGMAHPVHHFEYVPGQTMAELDQNFGKAVAPHKQVALPGSYGDAISNANKSVLDLKRVAAQRGLDLQDLHAGNKMIDRTGQGRLVDSFPVRSGDPNPFLGYHAPIDPRRGLRDMMQSAMDASESGGIELKARGPARSEPSAFSSPLMRPSRVAV